MIRLEALLYLREVAKTKSINKAADSLYVSKSALSTAIKNLENEFGVSLLNRSVHGVTLTQAGENVVEHAGHIFNIIENMKSDCQRYAGRRQKLNFFMRHDFSSSLFPTILLGLKKNFPNAYISSYGVDFKDIFVNVQEGKDNIGIFLDYSSIDYTQLVAKEYAGCIFKQIGSYDLCVVSAKYSKYVPLNVTSLTTKEIKDVPQIKLQVKWGEENGGIPVEAGEDEEYNYVLSTDNNTVFYQAILNDFGVGQMLRLNIPFGTADRKQLRFIPLKDGVKMDLWLVLNEYCPMETMVKCIETIKQTVEL